MRPPKSEKGNTGNCQVNRSERIPLGRQEPKGLHLFAFSFDLEDPDRLGGKMPFQARGRGSADENRRRAFPFQFPAERLQALTCIDRVTHDRVVDAPGCSDVSHDNGACVNSDSNANGRESVLLA